MESNEKEWGSVGERRKLGSQAPVVQTFSVFNMKLK